jgi:urea transport system substrate-binding protein
MWASSSLMVIWQSKGPLHPDPYDSLAFPGKTCVIK